MNGDEGKTRRQLMKSAAVLGGALTAASGFTASFSSAEASENRQGDRVLTVLFPNGDDARFDFDYYLGHHVPLVLSLYGKSIRRYEVLKPADLPGGRKPPYIAITQIWIADREAYNKASPEAAKKFRPDVPNFTNVTPVAQTGELYGAVDT